MKQTILTATLGFAGTYITGQFTWSEILQGSIQLTIGIITIIKLLKKKKDA